MQVNPSCGGKPWTGRRTGKQHPSTRAEHHRSHCTSGCAGRLAAINILGKAIDVVAVREELGLTQSELADLLGVSPRTIQSCEQEWRKPSAALEKALLLHLMIVRRGATFGEEACWDCVKCSPQARQQCPVYTPRLGHLCWMLTGNMCCSRAGRVEDWEAKKAVCAECPFFEKLMEVREPSAQRES